MGLGLGKLALRQPVAQALSEEGPDGIGNEPTRIPGLLGWWDASGPQHLRGPGGLGGVAWRGQCSAVVDAAGGPLTLESYRYLSDSHMAAPFSRISGFRGGLGQLNPAVGLRQPALDPDQGFRLAASSFGSGQAWTWFLVWTRSNRRQGSFRDSDPVALIKVGSTVILQLEPLALGSRLVLFPQSSAIVLSNQIGHRHTHSIILRHVPGSGVDVWLDDVRVCQGATNPLAQDNAGPVLLLHDGSFMGGAQCWFHEAAAWTNAITDAEMQILRVHASRWHRGARKAISLLINGQSNAVNYSLNDGAAGLLAQGVAWYLGAVAWHVIATTGNAANSTMQSGHGLYQVQAGGYPGNFLNDPGNGSPPSSWGLGTDGLALEAALQSLSSEDRGDIRAIVWPWSETDSLRSLSEAPTFAAAVTRFLDLERTMLGRTANAMPLIWWSAIPYGTAEGTIMHRSVVAQIANSVDLNVVIGNAQTADSNPRGAVWDSVSGNVTGGDPAHRDAEDNRRMARLAAPVVARALLATSSHDSIAALPAAIPQRGGPRIVHVYRESDTSLVLTVAHDAGTDLKLPRGAGEGRGFVVTDGAAIAPPATLINAIACTRISSTQLRLTLSSPMQHPAAACRLHYPYGGQSIGRGNAVTDNRSDLAEPVGWDIGAELGTQWKLDYPLSATMEPFTIADTPF